MAGAAKVDITPKESDLINKTDIIRDKIQVKAVYMTDGTTPAVIVTVDGDARTLAEPSRRHLHRQAALTTPLWRTAK